MKESVYKLNWLGFAYFVCVDQLLFVYNYLLYKKNDQMKKEYIDITFFL